MKNTMVLETTVSGYDTVGGILIYIHISIIQFRSVEQIRTNTDLIPSPNPNKPSAILPNLSSSIQVQVLFYSVLCPLE